MLIQALITGVVVGFIISMPPLGPTYFAIIERALRKEFANAVAIGAGAGFLDMIYVLVAFGGVSAIVSLLPESVHRYFIENEILLQFALGLLGCLIVILYGLKMVLGSRKMKEKGEILEDNAGMHEKVEELELSITKKEAKLGKIFHIDSLKQLQSGVAGSFLLGIGFCLSSVTLPASWLAIVGYLKSYGLIDTAFSTGLLLGLGVFAGTVLWFYVMSRLLTNNSDRIKPDFVIKLNFSTGIFLVLLGVSFLLKISSLIV